MFFPPRLNLRLREQFFGAPAVRASCALSCLALGQLLCPKESYGEDAIPGVSASMTRPVSPVLIRNAHGPLLRVIVEVGKVEDSDAFARNDVRLTALSFRLDGTDDLGDLDSLTLFSTGDKDEFSPATAVGEPVQPTAAFTFRVTQPLGAGKNVYWLSVRLKAAPDLAHHVAAVCTAVETTAGKLTPRNGSPGSRQRIGVALRQHQNDGVHTYRIPALATTPTGTLLCVYDMRRRAPGHDLQDDIDVGLSRSTNGGKTWERARVIIDMGEYGGLPQEQNGCGDPGLMVDQKTGEIFCFAVWMNGRPGKHQWKGNGSAPGHEIGKSAQFLMVRSLDDGRTWSKPENLTHPLKKAGWWLLAPSPQPGINLADGSLVMPVQGRDEKDAEFSTLMASRDHGATWTVGTPIHSVKSSECQAVQLGDGSLMLNMRNEEKNEFFRAVFVTHDLGQTWQPHATNRNTLIEPKCNGSLLRVDYTEAGATKHVLLFANPHSQQSRTHQTIQVSFDDGRTWPEEHHLLLDEGLGKGYPSLTRIDDRQVGIVYEGSQSQLVFQIFALDELLR